MEQALHHAQDAHRSAAPVGEFDAIVIGAGFAGLYALHKLRQQGLKVRVLEAGRDVGGTWYWNQYPGSRCDIESLEYSYPFDDDLQQEWHWPERFATAPDIQRYASHVSERFDLRDVAQRQLQPGRELALVPAQLFAQPAQARADEELSAGCIRLCKVRSFHGLIAK